MVSLGPHLPAAARGQPRAHSPAAMVSGFDSCRGKLRDTPKIFTFALSLPLPDGQERRKSGSAGSTGSTGGPEAPEAPEGTAEAPENRKA